MQLFVKARAFFIMVANPAVAAADTAAVFASLRVRMLRNDLLSMERRDATAFTRTTTLASRESDLEAKGRFEGADGGSS